MLVYCDSVILIYYFDHVGALQVRAANRLAALHTAKDQVVVSDMVRMECRVMPIRQSDQMKLALFDDFFTSPDVVQVPLVTARVRSGDAKSRRSTITRQLIPSISLPPWNTDVTAF